MRRISSRAPGVQRSSESRLKIQGCVVCSIPAWRSSPNLLNSICTTLAPWPVAISTVRSELKESITTISAAQDTLSRAGPIFCSSFLERMKTETGGLDAMAGLYRRSSGVPDGRARDLIQVSAAAPGPDERPPRRARAKGDHAGHGKQQEAGHLERAACGAGCHEPQGRPARFAQRAHVVPDPRAGRIECVAQGIAQREPFAGYLVQHLRPRDELFRVWCARRDSNPRPTGSKFVGIPSVALHCVYGQ